jgi:NADP-dependent 3-hydroxy acid dehydrogenase YdfG
MSNTESTSESNKPIKKLVGKKAIVTGASSGIGKEVALRLLESGAQVTPATVAEAIMTLVNLPADTVINDLVLMPNAGLF